MKIEGIASNCQSFKAALRVTPEAKNVVYNSGAYNTIVSRRVFDDAMKKFAARLCGEFPFAGDVFFDAISKKTKSLKPETKSRYEMRLFDKQVDFDFNHNRIYVDGLYHNNQPIEQKIAQESDAQAGYLFNTYLYLRGLCGK